MIVMTPHATPEQIAAVEARLKTTGVHVAVMPGERNMQNYALLEFPGKLGKPVLLKRGLSSSLDELLQAADYILKEGNEAVILCERGIRTFETATRFTLDLAAVPLRALVERNPGVNFAETNDVMMGAARGDGDQGYNVGRNAALLAGIDHHVPACTLNRFCASSLQTIRMAFHAIQAGEGDQYIAAGVESVSRAGLGAGMSDEQKHPKLS